jgi:benzoyl-CoA reductase/2-hydroxyglutaryl-CoA dehydratase subunit BcrC/BadD/HgdB
MQGLQLLVAFAEKLAKQAARSQHTGIAFPGIPISTLHHEIQLESTQRWQEDRENCTKAAITEKYFPTFQGR